ncbi:M23 family metallopeptidase [Nocardioides sp. TRM66260-LWL]|uniref:M23 family metallopeptidase n=1 Tax=Nocardioides sp. TRM66260-LWL TaxID=2874478 RepID=UPI001CC6C1DA|nr:M23 family metallopeptidase [Nocardioides sp. TRM66260-LWL]MBZ5736387.1 M23 family metallopeptidase [Nocardioides sp. TRM66260-LWL]
MGALVVAGAVGGGAAMAAEHGAAPRAVAADWRAPVAAIAADPSTLEQRESGISRSTNRTSAAPVDPADQAARQRQRVLRKQQAEARAYARELDARRWVLPVRDYHLTGTFGEASSLWSSTHTGLDFATTYGTAIHAVAAGTITEAGWAGSYGYRTIETLLDGTEIWYAHQSKILARVGDPVDRDEVIGEVGSTGNSTGSHVHLEVRPHGGDPIDPQIALPEHGVTP